MYNSVYYDPLKNEKDPLIALSRMCSILESASKLNEYSLLGET